MEKHKSKFYAVFRNGKRVSDSEYPAPLFAQRELEHWNNVLKKFPDGSRIEVMPTDERPSEPKS